MQRNGSNNAPGDFVRALRAADLDERIITFNPAGHSSGRVAASAAEIFVLEPVATAGRQTQPRRSNG